MERTPFTGETATQMHHARRGAITPEMRRVAEREDVAPEIIRDEVARGRMVIPANVHHAEPRADGHRHQRRSCKINANIGNSAVHSQRRAGAREAPLRRALRRRHRDGPLHRRRHRRDPRAPSSPTRPVPIGTVPIYQARAGGDAGRGPHRGRPDRHDRAPGEAGRRLHDHPLRRALRAPAARPAPHHRHRVARRLAARAVDGPPPQAEPALRALRQASSRSRASTTSRSRWATACGRAAWPTRATPRSSPS